MSEQTYDVILEGMCRPGTNLNEVKANIARLFRLQMDKVDKLFKGKPAIIKKGLDLALARKYQSAVKKAGAACKLRPLPSKSAGKRHAGNRKVLEIKACSESALYSPLSIPFVASHPGGLHFNRPDRESANFEDLQQVSFFIEKEEKKSGYRMLFFVQGGRRPYLVDASNIRYNQFVEGDAVTVPESARKFLLFLLENNPQIAVDAKTDAFLNGGRFSEIETTALLAYITSLGEAMKGATPPPPPAAPSVNAPAQTATPPLEQHAPPRVSTETAPPLSMAPSVSGISRTTDQPAMASEQVGEGKAPGKPEIDVDPFSWADLFSVSFVAGILVVLIVGLWKAPNMLYDFLTSRIKINGKPLRFDDNQIWVRLLPYTMPPSIFLICGLVLDVNGYHKGPLQDLLGVLFLISALGAVLVVPVLFLQAFLTHTRLAGEDEAFKPLFDGNGIMGVIPYIKANTGEYLTIVFAGLLIQSLILAPCGFALMVKITMGQLRVDGRTYTFEIPWFRTLTWCLFGYLTAFLGLFRYWAILYEDVLPSGKWVKADR